MHVVRLKLILFVFVVATECVGCSTVTAITTLPGESTQESISSKATPKSRLFPDYPAEMRGTGAAGSATVRFVIDEAGVVSMVTVLRATNEAFARAAEAAVAGWTYFPAKDEKGNPKTIRAEQTISFKP